MEEPKKEYILLVDHRTYVKHAGDNSWLGWLSWLGFGSNSKSLKVPRGELLQALPAAEQPSDVKRKAHVKVGLHPRYNFKVKFAVRLECPTVDLTLLSDEEASLLLAIPSAETRFQTFIDKKRLDFGRRPVTEIKQVFVRTEVKGSERDLPSVVPFKREAPLGTGTMFGVELTVGINSLMRGFMHFSAILL